MWHKSGHVPILHIFKIGSDVYGYGGVQAPPTDSRAGSLTSTPQEPARPTQHSAGIASSWPFFGAHTTRTSMPFRRSSSTGATAGRRHRRAKFQPASVNRHRGRL